MSNMPEGYVMGYGAELDVHRVEEFFDRKLSANELVLLSQDMIEGGRVSSLGPSSLRLVTHCVENGLSTISGRYPQ